MNKTLILIVSVGATLLLFCGVFFTLGGIVNTRSNIPPGLYWKVDKPLNIGKTIIFCPPNSTAFQEARSRGYINGGDCPDNYESLMLKVAAKYKDKVTINDTGVTINDSLYPQSKPQTQDKEGKQISRLVLENYVLKENELLLMSEATNDPYDSRYFGIISTEQVDSVIELFLP